MAPQTRTTRRPSTSTRVAGRSARSQPRVSRPTRPTRSTSLPIPGRSSPQSRRTRAGKKAKSPAGATGKLTGLLSALPSAAAKGRGKKSGGSSKAKPAFALLATGAGALLGRQQLNKRKQDESAQAVPVVDPPVTTPAAGGVDHTPPPAV